MPEEWRALMDNLISVEQTADKEHWRLAAWMDEARGTHLFASPHSIIVESARNEVVKAIERIVSCAMEEAEANAQAACIAVVKEKKEQIRETYQGVRTWDMIAAILDQVVLRMGGEIDQPEQGRLEINGGS